MKPFAFVAQAGKMKNLLFLALLLAMLFLGTVGAEAANRYVRAGALGSATGNDWTNAYPTLPATLTRGDTYYVAAGSYPSYRFDDPETGTVTITIKKATASDHGTDIGWQPSYGTGQAAFAALLHFVTGYYIFDGATRNESNWWDGTAYGFRVNFTDQWQQIKIGTLGGAAAHGVQIKHTYISAPLTLPAVTIRQYAIDTESDTATTGVLIHRVYVYGGNNTFFLRNTTGAIVEYSAAEHQRNNSANHGEVWNLFYNANNAIIRYNLVRDAYEPFFAGGVGTAVVALTFSFGTQVYGNVFWNFNTGDAVIGFAGFQTNDNQIYNNTFVDGWGAQGLHFGTGTNNVAFNNLWINSNAAFAGVTHDYNGFSDANARGEANAQINIPTSIFVNYIAKDFRLATPTNAGTILSSPFNLDALGNLRGADATWDRGAFEYPSAGVRPAPPTGLRIQ